jgi:hypothetical protein
LRIPDKPIINSECLYKTLINNEEWTGGGGQETGSWDLGVRDEGGTGRNRKIDSVGELNELNKE